ncbi:serine/threonine-protein kinase NLK isoform 1-T1 [Sarcophilus harrisii]
MVFKITAEPLPDEIFQILLVSVSAEDPRTSTQTQGVREDSTAAVAVSVKKDGGRAMGRPRELLGASLLPCVTHLSCLGLGKSGRNSLECPADFSLKYLHSAGILHRDIKPGNLLVNSNCVLKICDFGLARVEELDESRHMTQEVVTQYYRAPEILMGSRHYSNAIDIWSVGCIFAELLGRRILFQAQSPIQQLDLITDLLGTPSLEAMRTACEGAKAHILRGPHKQPSLPVLYTLSSQATHEAVHLLCRMLVFDPSKRISAKDALAHPYLDEGRLRYHTCMCKCCFSTSTGRVYTSDFEPVTNPKFDDTFEKNLSSVRQVKEIIHQFILEQQKGNRVPLCINPQSAAFKSFISSTVAQPSEMPPSPLVWE